ncbi:MAG: polysaccharide pyruvyl transferase family protein [Pseudomonadota bacterium]
MKRIFHVGAWNRNYGDYALGAGLHASLRAESDEPLEFVLVDCQNTVFHADLVDLINREGDLLLVGGGGLVFNRPEDHSRSGWQFNIDLDQLARLAVPLVVYGIGYNKFPFDETPFRPQTDAHLRATQEKAALFSVRNAGTRDELVRRGLEAEAITIIPDPGMFVPTAPINLPNLPEGGLKIGLNWAGDRPAHRYPAPAEENERAAARAVAEGLAAVLETHDGGGQVILISHLLGIDATVAPVLRAVLGERLYVLEEEAPWLFPPALAQTPIWAGLYRLVDVAVGMRGHANIIPFGLGTPFVGIGTHNKNRFFASEVGLADIFVDFGRLQTAEIPSTLHHCVSQTLDDPAVARQQKASFEACWSTARHLNQRICQKLLKNGK